MTEDTGTPRAELPVEIWRCLNGMENCETFEDRRRHRNTLEAILQGLVLNAGRVAPRAEQGMDLEHAARLLAKSLPDEMLYTLRYEWGYTNAAVVRHWRDAVLDVLAAGSWSQETK